MVLMDRCALTQSATNQSNACENADATDRPNGKGGAAIAPRNYPIGASEALVGRESPLVKANTPDGELTHRSDNILRGMF
jgi:hypothetical protein